MRHREGPQLHSWRGWDPPAVGEPGPQHRLFGVATAGVWLALRRPWENSLAPCFPTGTHSPPPRTWGCVRRQWVPGREPRLPGALQCGHRSKVGWQTWTLWA